MNIFSALIDASKIKAYYEADTNRPPYVGEIFFPKRKQIGLDFSYIKGKQGLPVALVASGFDVDVLYRDRVGFDTLRGQLPFFKEAYKIGEELRQNILSFNPEYRPMLMKTVFNGTNELIDGAEAAAERMRMSLLYTGTIAIVQNGVNKNYNFGFDQAKQTKTLTTLWTADGADPIKDILNEKREYKKYTKKDAKYLVANKAILDVLVTNAKIVEHFNKLPVPEYVTEDKAQAYVESVTGLKMILTDQQYIAARDTTKTAVDFYPDGKFTLLSTLDLGETLYGTTPEEADLMGGASAADSVSIVNTGVTITTWSEVDPVSVSVKASEVVLPTCPNIDLIRIVTYKNL